jgi:hypothetical protein
VGPRVVAGRRPAPFLLLRLSGLNWTKTDVLRRVGVLSSDFIKPGVSAISGRAAWVWGWPTGASSFLMDVSGGVIRPVHPAWLRRVIITAVASDGPADTWVAGNVGRQVVTAHWNGRSWTWVPVPRAEATAGGYGVTSLSASGPSNIWAAILDPGRGLPTEWVLHWNGANWSRIYAPPVKLYSEGLNSGPDQLSVASSSSGRAWVVYTQEKGPTGPVTGGGSPNGIPVGVSAYFDGTSWTTVRVPKAFRKPVQVTMAGGYAWAIEPFGPAVMYSNHGHGWCVQSPPPPPGDRCNLTFTSISAALPTYVVATASDWCGHTFAYVYDGHR